MGQFLGVFAPKQNSDSLLFISSNSSCVLLFWSQPEVTSGIAEPQPFRVERPAVAHERCVACQRGERRMLRCCLGEQISYDNTCTHLTTKIAHPWHKERFNVFHRSHMSEYWSGVYRLAALGRLVTRLHTSVITQGVNMRVLRTLLFCGMCCVWAQAGSVTYSTPAGSSVSGLPVDAEAVFSVSNGMIDVTLTNLQGNPTSVAQLLSNVSFTVGGGGSVSGASLSTSSGQEIAVDSTGSFTLGSSVSTGWGLTSGTNTAGLDVLGTSTAPTHLIIGPPGPGGTYSNANGSIAGNKPHNPFLNTSATFAITGPGITSSTTINLVTFSFGTTPGVTVNGVRGTPVPEPSAQQLLGLGTLGLMALATVSRKLISV